MRLEPVAKPVKIRIKLGDCECTELEQVKDNFSLKDIYPLYKDGRLSRWLKQIGHDELATMANDCLTNDAGYDDVLFDYISVLKIFYPDVKDIVESIDNQADDYFENLFKITRELVAKSLLDPIFPFIDIMDTWCQLVLKERDRRDLVVQLSLCIDSQEKYRIVFKYLLDYVLRDKDNAELLALLLSEMTPKGYDWKECMANDLNTDMLSRLFEIKPFRETIADWGELFASYMSNYDNDSNVVEPLLFSVYGDNELSQYYKILEDRGLFHPVNTQPQNIQSQNICFFDLDEKSLADHPLINQLLKDKQEFENVLKTIKSWLDLRKRYSLEYAISDIKRSNIVFKYEASKQIVEFVKGILLLEQNSNNKFQIDSGSCALFADVKSILNIMQSRKYTSRNQFTEAHNRELNVIAEKSSYLYDCVEDARSKSYVEVAYGIVTDLLNKLNNSRTYVLELKVPFEELLHNDDERRRVIGLISMWRSNRVLSIPEQIDRYILFKSSSKYTFKLTASNEIKLFLLDILKLEKRADHKFQEYCVFRNESVLLKMMSDRHYSRSLGSLAFNDGQKSRLEMLKKEASILDIHILVDLAMVDNRKIKDIADRIAMDLENILIGKK